MTYVASRRALLSPPAAGGGQYALSFNGSSSYVSCGSDSSLDDLISAAFTVEAWTYLDAALYGVFVSKSSGWAGNGWELINNWNQNSSYAFRAKTDAGVEIDANTATSETGLLTSWVHLAATYDDDGDRIARLFVNGGTPYVDSSAATGTLVSDASSNLVMGRVGSTNYLDGMIAWVRISNNIRYTTTFTPPAKDAPPEIDANTVEQWNFNDGAGTTLTAEVNSANNGTITDGSWVAL